MKSFLTHIYISIHFITYVFMIYIGAKGIPVFNFIYILVVYPALRGFFEASLKREGEEKCNSKQHKLPLAYAHPLL